MQMKRISEREAILERENGLLRALLTSDPSTMRRNIESMWANIEHEHDRVERENAALRVLLREVYPLLNVGGLCREANCICAERRKLLAKLEAQCK